METSSLQEDRYSRAIKPEELATHQDAYTEMIGDHFDADPTLQNRFDEVVYHTATTLQYEDANSDFMPIQAEEYRSKASQLRAKATALRAEGKWNAASQMFNEAGDADLDAANVEGQIPFIKDLEMRHHARIFGLTRDVIERMAAAGQLTGADAELEDPTLIDTRQFTDRQLLVFAEVNRFVFGAVYEATNQQMAIERQDWADLSSADLEASQNRYKWLFRASIRSQQLFLGYDSVAREALQKLSTQQWVEANKALDARYDANLQIPPVDESPFTYGFDGPKASAAKRAINADDTLSDAEKEIQHQLLSDQISAEVAAIKALQAARKAEVEQLQYDLNYLRPRGKDREKLVPRPEEKPPIEQQNGVHIERVVLRAVDLESQMLDIELDFKRLMEAIEANPNKKDRAALMDQAKIRYDEAFSGFGLRVKVSPKGPRMKVGLDERDYRDRFAQLKDSLVTVVRSGKEFQRNGVRHAIKDALRTGNQRGNRLHPMDTVAETYSARKASRNRWQRRGQI